MQTFLVQDLSSTFFLAMLQEYFNFSSGNVSLQSVVWLGNQNVKWLQILAHLDHKCFI